MDWIDVENELPDTDEEVLCYSDKNGGYFFLGYYRLGFWCEGGLLHNGKVVFWSPLEAPTAVRR